MRLRSATTGDAAFIVEMARHACVIEDWALPDADSKETQSLLPSRRDIAIVAADLAGAHLYQRKGFQVTGQGRGALGVAMRKDLR